MGSSDLPIKRFLLVPRYRARHTSSSTTSSDKAGLSQNLIGFIRSKGGEVLGASVLTGKPYSAKLAPDEAQINALKHKHGRELETWWAEKFGFGFGFGEVAFDPPTSKSSNGATPQYRT